MHLNEFCREKEEEEKEEEAQEAQQEKAQAERQRLSKLGQRQVWFDAQMTI